VTNVITDWRVAVIEYLAGEFAEADVFGGRQLRAGANRNAKDQIGVHWPGWPQLSRDIALATPKLVIRYWPKISKQPGTSTPRDPAPLEQAAVDLMVAMAAKRRPGDFTANVACHVADCIPNDDPEVWMVEATVEAFAMNLAVTAA
jgi:hypothetical protein